ncbi:MAG: cyclic nucleotide-binding domain-containing protein, partial [Pseudomonadota bacterium]
MIPVDALRTVPLLRHLEPDRFQWLSREADEVVLQPGDTLLRQGDDRSGFFIIAEGELLLIREDGNQETIAGRRTAPSFLGEISSLTDYPITVTCRAQTPCRLVHLRADVFVELLGCCPEVARVIFRTMVDRTTENEGIARDLEKMASLGTLAAGLAHELNNPAAAAVRALERAGERSDYLVRQSLALGADGPKAASALDALKQRIGQRNGPSALSALDAADAEDELAEWLAARGVADAWDLAPTLVAAGVVADDLDGLGDLGTALSCEELVAWVAAKLDLDSLLGEAATACGRISDLVGAVKSYSSLDQDIRQTVDIHQ